MGPCRGLDRCLVLACTDEMVHVWQHQLGYAVRWNGLFVSSKGADAYVYTLEPGTSISDYNMEQQGDIISDYYMIALCVSELIQVEHLNWANPPGWAAEWDNNDLIRQPDGPSRFAQEQESEYDFSEFGKALA